MKSNSAIHVINGCPVRMRRLPWSGAGPVLFAVMLLANPRFASAVIYNFSVPSAAPWYDTGIDIASGSQITISAAGIVQFGPLPVQVADANGGDYDGTLFYPSAVLPNTIVVSLIGKIGGTTDTGTGTLVPEGAPGKGPGFVGTSYSNPILAGGRLFLGYNDLVGLFGDNSGSFSVNLSVVPEPSALALIGMGVLAFCRASVLRKK